MRTNNPVKTPQLPQKVHIRHVFVKNRLHTFDKGASQTRPQDGKYVLDKQKEPSDYLERELAKKEGHWTSALSRIREHINRGGRKVGKIDADAALDYCMHASSRSPEALDEAMYEQGTHPRAQIEEKLNEQHELKAMLPETTWDRIEPNTRALLATSSASGMQADIHNTKAMRGLGIWHIQRGMGAFIIGSRSPARVYAEFDNVVWDLEAFPIAPDLALWRHGSPGYLRVQEMDQEWSPLLKAFNWQMWQQSRQVGSHSQELLNAMAKQASRTRRDDNLSLKADSAIG